VGGTNKSESFSVCGILCFSRDEDEKVARRGLTTRWITEGVEKCYKGKN
jgi:hypothetical protein